ncbi:hypothetical protein CPB86DRAFT_462714 [Serendipita vermifera]|nr:hypothetical protein CPB86DRAFT_462714 [Serendipita vermifera]
MAGFRKTGIWPLDKSVITPKMMAPSQMASMNASFPLPQSSPVRVFVKFFDTVMAESTDLMDRLTLEDGPENEGSMHPSSPPLASSPPSPSPVSNRASSALTDALHDLKHSSMAHLLSSQPLAPETFLQPPLLQPPPSTPSEALPRPKRVKNMLMVEKDEAIHELRRKLAAVTTQNEQLKGALAGAQIQLSIQYLHVRKQDMERISKYKPPANSIYPGGKGQVLTGDPFMAAVRKRNDHAEAEARLKEQKRQKAAEKRIQMDEQRRRKQDAAKAWEHEKRRYENAMQAYTQSTRGRGRRRGRGRARVSSIPRPQRRRMAEVMAPYLDGTKTWANSEDEFEVFNIENTSSSDTEATEGSVQWDSSDYTP